MRCDDSGGGRNSKAVSSLSVDKLTITLSDNTRPLHVRAIPYSNHKIPHAPGRTPPLQPGRRARQSRPSIMMDSLDPKRFKCANAYNKTDGAIPPVQAKTFLGLSLGTMTEYTEPGDIPERNSRHPLSRHGEFIPSGSQQTLLQNNPIEMDLGRAIRRDGTLSW